MNENVSPTKNQIELVEKICRALGIDNFPSSSTEYNSKTYTAFIEHYLEDFQNVIAYQEQLEGCIDYEIFVF